MSEYTPTTTLEVAPFVYTMRHADTSVGIALGMRLANMAAPMLRAAKKNATLEDALAYVLGQPDLGANIQTLGKGFAPFTTLTAAGVEVGSLDKVYESHFAGRYDLFVQWLVCVCRFDLSSFLVGFSLVGDELESAFNGAKSDSKSPKAASMTG